MTNSLNNAKKKIMALALTGALALTLIPDWNPLMQHRLHPSLHQRE